MVYHGTISPKIPAYIKYYGDNLPPGGKGNTANVKWLAKKCKICIRSVYRRRKIYATTMRKLRREKVLPEENVYYRKERRTWWSATSLDWGNVLEGMEVHIPTPKTHFAQDIELNSDIPFFATSIGPITFVGKSNDPAGENAMMACRWNEFKFTHSIPGAQQRKCPNCSRCFAELIFLGSEMD